MRRRINIWKKKINIYPESASFTAAQNRAQCMSPASPSSPPPLSDRTSSVNAHLKISLNWLCGLLITLLCSLLKAEVWKETYMSKKRCVFLRVYVYVCIQEMLITCFLTLKSEKRMKLNKVIKYIDVNDSLMKNIITQCVYFLFKSHWYLHPSVCLHAQQ